jgi:hypothetical protein
MNIKKMTDQICRLNEEQARVHTRQNLASINIFNETREPQKEKYNETLDKIKNNKRRFTDKKDFREYRGKTRTAQVWQEKVGIDIRWYVRQIEDGFGEPEYDHFGYQSEAQGYAAEWVLDSSTTSDF